jgi:UDP-N-acetylmuramoyl-tripeptide--D-alanyl-D-alanine ligase
MTAWARFTLEDVRAALDGVSSVSDARPFDAPAALSTDTRSLQPGDFYVPLCGECFDGHQFLPQAMAAGAVGAVIAEDLWQAHPEWHGAWPNCFVVPDTTLAYLQLARFHRRRCPATVIALTGSSGKTTSKEMLAAMLSPLAPTQATEKNHNNEIGVSQTLLSLLPETCYLVVEMGMRGLGQIELLTRHAEPDIAMVLNVGPAHIELLGSLENIAVAKCEIYEGLKPEAGIAIVNDDDARILARLPKVWNGRTERFSLSRQASAIENTPEGGIQFDVDGHRVRLQVPGRHQVANALAALAVGRALGYSLEQLTPGLEAYQPVGSRWARVPIAGATDGWMIDDAYNANPDSMRAALSAFLDSPKPDGGRRVLVLGGMKELGAHSGAYHVEIGYWLKGLAGIDGLIGVGLEAQTLIAGAHGAPYPLAWVETAQEVPATLKEMGFTSLDRLELLIKGSRGHRLEQIVSQLGAPAGVTP